MGKTIIVAGAGHGGLAAAAQLAKKGYDVTVIERGKRDKLGYDWTDIFDPRSLSAAIIPYPQSDKYTLKENMTFYSPSRRTPVTQEISDDEREIKMERSDIYAHLIDHAEKCGVKLKFGRRIIAPVMLGNRVAGVETNRGGYLADLVIDAAGLNSPIRQGLPKMCGVEHSVGKNEQFFVYRAFYNRVGDFCPERLYQVSILHEGERRIAWLATEGEFVDVLIGRFEPFGMIEVENALEALRRHNPHLGTEVMRGGEFVNIPVRQPLSVLVADGYAAIGDSAFMTVPIIGSGIANSLKASHMLVKAITDDKNGAYTAETLWPYQLEYYRALGSGYAAMACLKLFLLKLNGPELDFIFDNGILTVKEFSSLGTGVTNIGSMLKMTFGDFVERAKAVCTDKILLTKIIKVGSQVAAAAAICAMLPPKYNTFAVSKWADTYVKFFRRVGNSD
ncbi:MAG: NAD(P)-binding protein [Oscillospiraceae bacterium]|nr:NAD(P)-binding protein [Oscillospiraceae bacterium]